VAPTATPAQEARSDAELVRVSPQALANAHGESPRYGGIFKSVVGDIVPHFDTGITKIGGTYHVASPVYNGLLAHSPYDAALSELLPDLATTWQFSSDGTQLIMNLVQGAKFQDGQAFDSDDVVFSFNRLLNPPEGLSQEHKGLVSAGISSVEAIDSDTIAVNLLVPSLAMGALVNGHAVIYPEHIGRLDPVDAFKTVAMGTGPYRMTSSSTTSWAYERNTDYFKAPGLPYLDGLSLTLILDPQTAAAAVVTNRAYWLDVYPNVNHTRDLVDTMISQRPGDLERSVTVGLIHAYFILNASIAPFDDLRVRQALSEAIDRDQVAEFSSVDGSPGLTMKPGSFWELPADERSKLVGYGPDMSVRIENAKALLAEYEAEKGDIDWSQHKMWAVDNLPWTIEAAEVIQQQFRAIGVDVEIQLGPGAQVRPAEIAGDFSMSSLGTATNSDDPTELYATHMLTDSSAWFHRLSVPVLDETFEEQKFETDLEKRRALIWANEREMTNQAGWLVLYWFNLHHAKATFVKGWVNSPIIAHTNSRYDYTWLDLPETTVSR
jgi:peptide/nickel transport system substrate-binding protein